MPELDFWTQFLWIGGVIAASIAYRLWIGKPVQPVIPDDALYFERKAGGPWAANCLLVSITTSELKVEPTFPFTLMFLPEIWGTEYRVQLHDVEGAEVFRGWLMNTKVRLRDSKRITLRLKRPNSFLQALQMALKNSRI